MCPKPIARIGEGIQFVHVCTPHDADGERLALTILAANRGHVVFHFDGARDADAAEVRLNLRIPAKPPTDSGINPPACSGDNSPTDSGVIPPGGAGACWL